MAKKPKRQEVLMAKKTLKRWYGSAKNRNKENVMFEIKKIYEMLEYFEEHTDFRIID